MFMNFDVVVAGIIGFIFGCFSTIFTVAIASGGKPFDYEGECDEEEE